MGVLLARKRIPEWMGNGPVEAGQPLVPQPTGIKRQVLLNGRFVVEEADPVTDDLLARTAGPASPAGPAATDGPDTASTGGEE